MSKTTPVLLGSLEEQVMLAVVRTRDQAYGMNVRRELESVTARDIAIGAVYATLDRLEAKGLVSSKRVGAAETPSRRIFQITSLGVRSLMHTRTTRERLWIGVTFDAVTKF